MIGDSEQDIAAARAARVSSAIVAWSLEDQRTVQRLTSLNDPPVYLLNDPLQLTK